MMMGLVLSSKFDGPRSRFSGCEFKEPEKDLLFYEIVNLLVKQLECPNELKSIIAANYRQSHYVP